MKNVLNDQLSISQQDDCQSRKDTNKVLTKTSDEQETTTHMGAITKKELTTEEQYTAQMNGCTCFKIILSQHMICFVLITLLNNEGPGKHSHMHNVHRYRCRFRLGFKLRDLSPIKTSDGR